MGDRSLLNRLHSSDPEERLLALREVDEGADQRIQDAAVQLLRDSTPDIRRAAAIALAHADPERAVESLPDNLDDQPPDVQQVWLIALGRTGEDSVASIIESRLDHDHPSVRQGAIKAIEFLGTNEAIEGVARLYFTSENDEVSVTARRTMRKLLSKEEFRDRILAALRSDDRTTVLTALNGVYFIDGDVRDDKALAEKIARIGERGDAEIQHHAVYALDRLSYGTDDAFLRLYAAGRDEEVHESALEKFVGSGTPGQHLQAIVHAAEHGDVDGCRRLGRAQESLPAESTAVDRLSELLDATESDRVTCAALGLGAVGTNECIQAVLEATESPVSATRAAAVRGFEFGRNPRAVETLLGMLRDEDIGVRIAAAETLDVYVDDQGPLTIDAVRSLLSVLEENDVQIRRPIVSTLVDDGFFTIVDELTAAEVDTLIDQLDAPDSEIRKQMPFILRMIARPMIVPPLIDALSDNDEWVRREAARHLGLVGTDAGECLERTLNGSPYFTVAEIGGFADSRAVEPLIEHLRCPSETEEVKFQCVLSLGRIAAPRVVTPLVETLVDGEPALVRAGAAKALSWLGEPRTKSVLVDVLLGTDVPTVRAFVATALGNSAFDATEELCQALTDFRPNEDVSDPRRNTQAEVRDTAALALGRTGDVEARKPLEEALHTDPEATVREASARALCRLGLPETIPALEQAVEDDDASEVRETARKALASLNDANGSA